MSRDIETDSPRMLTIATGLFVLALVGYFGVSTGIAQDGPPEDPEAAGEATETSAEDRSYEKRVSSLREIADEPELELEDAPPAGSTVERSDEEWRQQLSEQEFRILRESGTEPAGSGDLLDNKKQGVYRCAACGAPLFSSRDKFDSGTGWPSYTAPYEKGRVDYSRDAGIFTGFRVEVHCARCGGHLGHVFPDGPQPTGERYCINSAALDFEAVSDEDD